MKTVTQLLALLLIVSTVVGEKDPRCIPARGDRKPEVICYKAAKRHTFNADKLKCDEHVIFNGCIDLGPSFSTNEACLATCLE